MTALLAQATVKGPEINWEALSPAIALTVGACVVLLVGLARSRFVRGSVVPVLTLVTLAVTAGLCVWQWDVNEAIIARALVIDNLTLTLTCVFVAGGMSPCSCRGGRWPRRRPARASTSRCMLTSILGMVVLVAANDLVVLFIGFELLSIPLVRAVRDPHAARALARVGPEVPDHRLGRLGDAAVWAGAVVRRRRRDELRRRSRAVGADLADDPLFLTGIALVHRGAGVQGLGGAVPPVDAGRL